MRTQLSVWAVAFLAGVAGLGAGCASEGRSPSRDEGSAVHADAEAVLCEQCRMTWVRYPIREGRHVRRMNRRIVGFGTRQSHECPECRKGLEGLFATGHVAHSCKICGGRMERCESHPL